MNIKAFLSGVLVGTVIAATTTLLTTPASGQAMRQKGKVNVRKIRSTLEQLSVDSKNVVDQLKKTTKLSKETFKDLSIEMKDSIHDWKEDVEPALDQLRADIDSLKRNVEQAKKTFS